MKNKFRKLMSKIKKHRKICLTILAAIVLVVILYAIFSLTGTNTIKKVKKISKPAFYSAECFNEKCDYVIALKGDKLGKYTTYIYDANGKKIAKIKDKYDTKTSFIKSVSNISKKYIIFKNEDYTTNKVNGYSVTGLNGKVKYNSKNVLYSLTDYLISEKDGNNYKIIDTKGKDVLTNVSDIEVYANNTILSLKVNNKDIITNEKGESILNGYKIATEKKNENGDAIYFILEDSNKNAYYYYNIAKNKIIGDSFNGYSSSSNDLELIISKKENGSVKKYILTEDGKLRGYDSDSITDLTSKINSEIDHNIFKVYKNSIKLEKQKTVFVNNLKENSFGAYDILSKKYNKLFDFKEENGLATLYELTVDEKNAYVQVNCSASYCKKSTMIVYDMVNGKELYRLEDETNLAQSYTEFEGGYKVIKYSLSSSEDYKGKYVLYDKENKELIKSDSSIVVVDKRIVFGKKIANQGLILYNSKNKKVINNETNLGSKITVGTTNVYKYNDDKNTYLLSDKGKTLKKLSIESASLIYSNDAIIYIENNKVNIINPASSKSKSYRLKGNEKINDNSGENIAPYKNSIFINNTVNNYVKVIDVNGRIVKKLKNQNIYKVNYNSKNDTVIIITKNVVNNNNEYGLYIAK